MNDPRSEDLAHSRAFWVANTVPDAVAPAYVPTPPVAWHVALVLVAALLLQSTFAPLLALRGGTVSFVMLLVAWYATRVGTLRGFTLGLVAGLCEDALAGTTGVGWTFSTALAGAFAGRVANTWAADLRLVLVPGVAALGLARFAAFAVIEQMLGRPLASPVAAAHAALWQALLDAAIALVVLTIWPQLRVRDGRANGR